MFWNQNWLNSSVLNPAGTSERGFCLVSFNFYTNMQQKLSFISCVISPTLHILVYCFWQWWKTGISWPFVFWVLHKLCCAFREYFLLLSCSRFLIWKAALEIPGSVATFLELQVEFCACVRETGACPYKRKVVVLLGLRICRCSNFCPAKDIVSVLRYFLLENCPSLLFEEGRSQELLN